MDDPRVSEHEMYGQSREDHLREEWYERHAEDLKKRWIEHEICDDGKVFWGWVWKQVPGASDQVSVGVLEELEKQWRREAEPEVYEEFWDWAWVQYDEEKKR